MPNARVQFFLTAVVNLFRSDRLGTDLNPEGLRVSRILSFKSYQTSVCAFTTKVFVLM